MNRMYGMSVNVYATLLYVEVCLVYGLHAVIYSSFKKINVIDRIRYITYMLEPYTHDNFHFRWVPLFSSFDASFQSAILQLHNESHGNDIFFLLFAKRTIFPEKFPHQTCNTVCRQYVFVQAIEIYVIDCLVFFNAKCFS